MSPPVPFRPVPGATMKEPCEGPACATHLSSSAWSLSMRQKLCLSVSLSRVASARVRWIRWPSWNSSGRTPRDSAPASSARLCHHSGHSQHMGIGKAGLCWGEELTSDAFGGTAKQGSGTRSEGSVRTGRELTRHKATQDTKRRPVKIGNN